MQVVRYARCVGTMIGLDGPVQRWTASLNKIIQRVLKINASTGSLVERLCDFQIYCVSVLSKVSAPPGKRTFLLPPCLIALWMPSILYVDWTAMENLKRPHKTRSRRLPLDYSVMIYISRILLDQPLRGPPKFWDRTAVIELRTSCHT